MASWKGQSKGTPLGYRIFIFLIRHFGIKSAYLLLRFVSFYYSLFSAKKHQYFYFQNILRKSKRRAFWSIVKNNYVFGQVLIDKVAALSGNAKGFSYDFDGEEYLHQMKSGGFLIGAHMGNWEIAGELLKRLDIKVHILMYENEKENIKSLLNQVESEKTMNIITLSDDMSHIIAIKNAMDNNELVVIHGDRFADGAPYIEAQLMGHQAKFPYGPYYLVARFNKPVSFVFAFKETSKHYHFYATKPKLYPKVRNLKDRKLISGQILSEYIPHLEDKIRKYPHQWFNFYDFWEQRRE
jgi:predicted LPLAT superfamily acyltransferase